MSGESSKRSSLIDVTYAELHAQLEGHLQNSSLAEIATVLELRLEHLRNIAVPFGKPSDASKKKIESGSVTLHDGVVIHVEGADEYVFAISDKFQIDQVQALILCRSFLYNVGTAGDVEDLVKNIASFYFQERIHVLRVLIPLFRAHSAAENPAHFLAKKILPKIVPDAEAFANTLIDEYVRKTRQELPAHAASDPKTTSLWAKQIGKEQLVLLEVLFWTMFDIAPCNGPLVVRIYETAYETNLGSVQQNSMALLDDEGVQLQQDSAALWIVIMVEVLCLERIVDEVEVSDSPQKEDIYTTSPESLKRIHELVVSHSDSQHACTYLAWAFVLSRLTASVTEQKAMPESYRPFFEPLLPHLNRSKEREPTHVLMTGTCLAPEVGLFNLLLTLLQTSPLFVTSVAWRTGSSVTDPNATSFRSVIRGLIMALMELVPVELIPDFDGLVEVWITLFGRSESAVVATLCQQFWDGDFKRGIARRAIFDVARSRLPIHLRPLIRLLRAMTGSGFLDTDPLYTADRWINGGTLEYYRAGCDGAVADYFDRLPTYSQVIPVSACTGANAIYERIPERYGSPSASTGVTYMNLRPIRLPGGKTLPTKSIGRLLSGDGGDFVVVCWEHEHSGWAMLLEVLTDYVNRKRLYSGTSSSYQDVSFGRRGSNQPVTLRLEDIGVEMDNGGDEEVVTDILDLVRSVIQDNPDLARNLVQILELGDPVVAHTMTESQPPDLVQLTTMVLEEALSRSAGHGKAFPRTQLITSSISVLSALLTVPNIADRVWLYIRSAASLFGSDRTAGFASVALAAERVTGHYTMTLALLHLVQGLFHEASSSVLSVPAEKSHLQQVKEEVLLRAARFVHTEIWVEHMGWKYAQLADRFEIGRRVSSFYAQVLEQAPPALGDKPFATLSQAIADAWVHKATTSTINPLVTSIATAGSILRTLIASRRTGDARRLVYLLQSHLHLTRLVINYKQSSSTSSTPCLLEQTFCTRVTGGATFDTGRSKVDPIDILASYVKARDMGFGVPLEAMRVLYTLCASFSSSQPSPPSIIGHLSDPEATVASLVQIIHHPYYDSVLRIAVWHFIALAMDKEPALAILFVTGQFRLPAQIKGKGKAIEDGKADAQDPDKRSAIDVARDRLATWKELRESNPPLLASVLQFLDVVWQHGLEHQGVLESLRKDPEFWDQMGSVAREEVGPSVDYKAESYIKHDDGDYSDLHVAVSENSYRAMIKSYALHIIGTDISIHLQLLGRQQRLEKPISYLKIEEVFKDHDQLNDLACESVASEYNPTLYDEFMEQVSIDFPKLTLEQIRSQIPADEREFGDDFAFSTSLLRSRLPSFSFVGDSMDGPPPAKSIELLVRSINLNLSLTYSQTSLTESVQYLLRQVVPFVRGDDVVRPIVLDIAAAVSRDTSKEKRPGDMMATVHGARLSLLLSLVEVAWFSTADKKDEVASFIAIVDNVHGIILNELLSPAKSLLGQFTAPFHRTLLQVVFFCAKHCRNLAGRPKTLNAEQRLTITAMFDATLNFTIDALQLVFGLARSRLDLELDRDMELLVAVFEQCTRPDINKSSIHWLTRCQETDVIKSSLELFVHVDLVGLSDLSLLRLRRQPLYSPHVLTFHVALVGVPLAAERFASEGVLTAYSNNSISSAISAGLIDVTLPELPGERSPAHRAYCSMLAIVAGVVSALGRHNHFFDAEASGFVQLYGDQITRALSWTIGDPITFPLIQEIEQVVNLFYSIAASTPSAANTNPAVTKVLRVFSNHALILLQQVNYALTHPNHLASLFEPVTADERAQIEKEPRDSPGVLLSSSEIMHPMKRPLTTRLIHRLFKLSSSILSTLISISRADDVLIKEQEDWSLNEALVIPHSKVVLDEPASIGTLLELGNCTLDVLRDLVNHPAGQTIIPPPSSTYERPFDVKQGVLTSRQNLEAVCLYAITQLGMWVSKPEFDAGGDIEVDEPADNQSLRGDSKERRRASLTIGERLRRGMTGEMNTDLQSLLQRAKPVIQKSEAMVDSGSGGVDLTQVLLRFLHDRIGAAL